MEKKKKQTANQTDDAQRLRSLYESKKTSLGLTQQHIADALDISQGAVGHYLHGRNPLNLSVVAKFAELLQVSISDISPTLAKEASRIAQLSNVTFVAPYKASKSYPVISNVQAGAWCEAVEAYTAKDIDLWLESDAHIQGDAFWLRVEGDSMTAPVGLSIPEGTYVLFDTEREAVNGNLVIAKLSDSNEATFKKLVIDGGQKYLKGLNPHWPLVPINGNCRIIGVAVETKLRLV
ncbi:LexA family protein [Klebsiella michiganensis]|nr:helix-turn-helix domain-containing protein [Klebsiella michiganensis]